MSTANIIGNGIFGLRNKSGGNYIDPSVKESLVGLWKFDQNTNESPTRNIIKNTIKDKGGDLELLNFAYKANSGYNGYPEDFTTYIYNTNNVITKHDKVSFNGNVSTPTPIIYKFLNGNDSDLEEYTINFTKIGDAKVTYRYIDINGNLQELELIEGKNKLPYSYVSKLPIDNTTIWIGYKISKGNGCTITQLPLYEGALVTDGKDDIIVSQKTVQEMLGGSNVCTVVSMIHQINLSTVSSITSINNIRSESVAHVCARHLNTDYGKTGIFGYSKQLNTTNNPTLINNILGDKRDYIAKGASVIDTTDKYFVQGYKYNDSLHELSELAVYWTFIANKVLTTDEINQIIAYYKLDKYITPQVIYDVKRQGLTNDTPAADWYLKDFSGNGHDMQLYNYAKKGNSGVGKYEVDFTSLSYNSSLSVFTATYKSCSISKIIKDSAGNIFYNWGQTLAAINSTKIQVTGLEEIGAILEFMYLDESGSSTTKQYSTDGIYDLPASAAYQGDSNNINFRFSIRGYVGDCDVTIEQIPDYEGALVSDGKDDYGHVDNLPVFKDYTVAIDRAWTKDLVKTQCLASKLNGNNFGSFSFELIENGFSSYSFGVSNKGVITIDSNKKISYQSKHVYNGSPIVSGNNVDGKDLFLFRNRDSYPYYAEAAIWSYILFPYTLSEFLLERQLKKYKLGTLYPDMVEWRPKVNINVPVVTPPTFSINNGSDIITNGQYIPEGTEITIRIFIAIDGSVEGINEVTAKINGVDIELTPSGNKTYYGGKFIISSKQKIDITIDEYIRFEDIVQPYPYIVKLRSLDGHIYTYGDKLKVGDEIKRGEAINLLPGLYEGRGLTLNGVPITSSEAIITVSKSMVFTANKIYLLDTTEPHAIYSPQKLNIPNSSLKILGYVPDLTGKGNHGVTNNFAWALNSGANGYLVDFTTWSKINAKLVTDNKIVGDLVGWICYLNVDKLLPTFKVFISGIPNGGRLRFTGSGLDQLLQNGENTIQGVGLTTSATGFISSDNSLDWSNLVIQQIGEHEGSICFDGTDDYITIPTLAHGGKCVMMKVNLQSYDRYLYDQRNSWSQYLAIVSAGNTIAYQYSNEGGKTYIDGILNENIIDKDLIGITHNITVANSGNAVSYSPNIGTSFAKRNFTNMSLYEFMLFPEIPSEDEIKKLNDVMGIEENLFLIHLKNDDTEIIN